MTLLPPAHKVTRHLVLIRSARIRPVPPHQAWDDQGLGIGGTGVSPSPSRLKAPHTVSRDGVALATGARFPSSNLRGSRWSWFLRIKIPCPPRSHNMCGTEFHLRNPAPPGVVYRRARGERCLMVAFRQFSWSVEKFAARCVQLRSPAAAAVLLSFQNAICQPRGASCSVAAAGRHGGTLISRCRRAEMG